MPAEPFNASPDANAPLRSEMSADPDLAELVEMYVEEMPDKVAAFEQAASGQDWETLRTISHQLKGSAGGYGFPQIGSKAAEVESCLKEQRFDDELTRHIGELISLCRRAAV